MVSIAIQDITFKIILTTINIPDQKLYVNFNNFIIDKKSSFFNITMLNTGKKFYSVLWVLWLTLNLKSNLANEI